MSYRTGWCSLVAAGLLLSCGREPARTKVIVNQAFEHLLYIGLYVAKDAGFFDEEGLEVTINTGGGDAQAFAALSSGAADFAQGDPAFVAIAQERGWDGRVVAMAVNRVAIWGVSRDSLIAPFTDPGGFRGRHVSTYPRPNTSYVVQEELVQRAGLTLGKNTWIKEVAFGTELAALERGDVDIAQTIEPNVTQFEQKGGRVVFSYPEAWGPLAFTGVMVALKTIKENPDKVEKFVRAYARAYRFLRSNTDSTISIAARRLPSLDRETIKRALQRLLESQSLPVTVAVDSASWRKLLDVRVKVGDLKAFPANVLYDNTFAQHADSVVR